jgi:hypothetical protein
MTIPIVTLVGLTVFAGALFEADGNKTPMKIQPRIVLCILHDNPDVVRAICARSRFFDFDEEYSNRGRDDRMAKAFELSWDLVRPSATDGDKQQVEQHRNVAYVLSRRLDSDVSMEIALDGLVFIKEAFAEGARAVKCDSSGIAHGKVRWLELATKRSPMDAYFAYVRRPIGSDEVMYSCGMHLLGLRDIKVDGFSDRDAAMIMDVFAGYLITEGGNRTVKEGHTFSCSKDDPILRISQDECRDYETDDFFFNPYGYWVLTKKDARE